MEQADVRTSQHKGIMQSPQHNQNHSSTKGQQQQEFFFFNKIFFYLHFFFCSLLPHFDAGIYRWAFLPYPSQRGNHKRGACFFPLCFLFNALIWMQSGNLPVLLSSCLKKYKILEVSKEFLISVLKKSQARFLNIHIECPNAQENITLDNQTLNTKISFTVQKHCNSYYKHISRLYAMYM